MINQINKLNMQHLYKRPATEVLRNVDNLKNSDFHKVDHLSIHLNYQYK